MIIVEQPYISQFLKQTIVQFNIPVLDTEIAEEMEILDDSTLIDEKKAIQQYLKDTNKPLYTISENALEWISQQLSSTKLPGWIELFKDKVKFRQLISKLYPDFHYQQVAYLDLEHLDIEHLSFPFIIKPAIGFFSLGVKKVDSAQQWTKILDEITIEMEQVKGLFPKQVLNTSNFIIEQYIEGEEYAFDAYFDIDGKPVILGIYHHIFSSSSDVSDRIYMTSREIIEDNLGDFTELLNQISSLTSIRNFPLHVEVRRDSNGNIMPIEVNPLRFGGWCTTADMTFQAFGLNPYEYYFGSKIPDWEYLVADKNDIYSIVILDNSTGIEASNIAKFDYDKLLQQFENPLELRKIDYHQYPLFGFLFTQTSPSNFNELDKILKSDLTEFIQQPVNLP